MPFVSDEQRKAAFANMKDRGGKGGGPKPPKSPKPPKPPGGAPDTHPGLLALIESILKDSDNAWIPLPNGEGIPGWGGGSVTLTGGAIYGTPNSQWYIAQSQITPPNNGQLPGYGVPAYQQEFTQYWTPPATLAGQIWSIMAGVDPWTGEKFSYDPWDPGYIGMLEAEFSANPGGTDYQLNLQPLPGAGGGFWNPFE